MNGKETSNSMYVGDGRISYYDLDMRGKLKLSALLRMVHIAADANAASLGIGFADLSKLSMTFVLLRIGFKFIRMPVYNELVTIRTWPSDISKGTFLRQGDMYDSSGKKLIEWASLWILFDLNDRKILKPSKLPVEIPELASQNVEVVPKKITLPVDLAAPYSVHTHTVRYADTDTNIHMNNSIYGDLVGNAVFPSAEEDGAVSEFNEVQINYLSEAKFGVGIDVTATKHGDEIYVVGEADTKRVFLFAAAYKSSTAPTHFCG